MKRVTAVTAATARLVYDARAALLPSWICDDLCGAQIAENTVKALRSPLKMPGWLSA